MVRYQRKEKNIIQSWDKSSRHLSTNKEIKASQLEKYSKRQLNDQEEAGERVPSIMSAPSMCTLQFTECIDIDLVSLTSTAVPHEMQESQHECLTHSDKEPGFLEAWS